MSEVSAPDEQDMWEEEDPIDLLVAPGAQKGDYGILFEEPPVPPKRPAPPGRERFPWHRALEPIRQRRGEWASFVAFPDSEKGKSQAQAKAQSVRNQLISAAPDEHWDVRARERDGEWRVYAKYHGKLSAEQQAERDRQRKARSDRVREGVQAKATG